MKEIFARQYRFNQLVIVKGISDLSQAESLWQRPQGNCINFVAGHIVASRANLFASLGVDTYWPKAKCLPYIRGAAAIDSTTAYPIEEILQAVHDTKARLDELLPVIDYSQPDPDGDPQWENMATLICHETYHAGQIHLLRRMIGRDRSFG